MRYAFPVIATYSSLNLNDGIKYLLMDFDLGESDQEEAWIESFYVVNPILSQSAPRKTKMSLMLRVNGQLTAGGASTHANLVANIEAVRNEFYRNNSIKWSYDGGTVYHEVQTFKSSLSPVPTDGDHGLVMLRDHVAYAWRFEVTRHPFEINQSSPLVI